MDHDDEVAFLCAGLLVGFFAVLWLASVVLDVMQSLERAVG